MTLCADSPTPSSGAEALSRLESEAFDLMLLDVQMPEMDGYEVAAAIRLREQTTGHRLPIIAMTAHTTTEAKEHCVDSGMDGYAAKPIRDHELKAEIDRVVGPRVESSAVTVPTGLNPDVALARVGGNRELLHEMLEIFTRDCESLSAEVRAALREGDATRVGRAAHTIKGMVGFFGSTAGAQSDVQLEEIGKHGQLSQAETALDALEREIAAIQSAFADLSSTGLSSDGLPSGAQS